jgi:hypothetical protein
MIGMTKMHTESHRRSQRIAAGDRPTNHRRKPTSAGISPIRISGNLLSITAHLLVDRFSYA